MDDFYGSYQWNRGKGNRGKLKRNLKRPTHPQVQITKYKRKPKTEIVFDGEGLRRVPDGHGENGDVSNWW